MTSAPAEVLQYIQALRWPVVVAGGIVLQRKAIGHLINRLRMPDEGTITVPGIGEIAFRNRMQEVAIKADEAAEEVTASACRPVESEAALPADAEPHYPQIVEWDSIDRLVVTDPTGAITQAWERVAGAIRGYAYSRKITASERDIRDPVTMAMRLALPKEVVEIVRDLRDLRNAAENADFKVNSTYGVDYVRTAKVVAKQILPEFE